MSALCVSPKKATRVAVMEMGRRWTPQNLPPSSWYLHRWFWRPSLALRGFFSMRYFRHVTILHGCAVGGGSITYACTMLRPPDKVWDSGSWRGLANWKSEMPQHYDTASRMLGVIENRILGPVRQTVAARCRRGRRRQHLLSHPRRDLAGEGRRAQRREGARSLLRRRRSRAHHLHWLWRLHDGLPRRRQEHAGHELSLPRREARRAGFRRDQSGRCSPARRRCRRQSRIRSSHRELDCRDSTATLAASPAAVSSSPRRRWGRWSCSST